MKSYLLQAFDFSDWAFEKQFETVRRLAENQEILQLISHLINAKIRWKQRLSSPEAVTQQPFFPVYEIGELPKLWHQQQNWWKSTIISSQDMAEPFKIITAEGLPAFISLQDICVQLIYHDIHHRAQIQVLIKSQGHVPPVLDYFRTVLKPAV